MNFIKKYKTNIIAILMAMFALSGILCGLFDGGFDAATLKFFTYQSNIMVFVALVFCGIFSTSKNQKARQIVLATVAITIFITFAIQNFAIVPLTSSTYFQNYHDVLTHIITPLMFLTFYFCFENKGFLNAKHIAYFIIYPLCYYVICALTGYEPYFFLEISKIGIAMALVWLVIFLLVFVGVGFVFVFLSKKAHKTQLQINNTNIINENNND